jgi:predicted Zn-ribbon and HTH transcriptional regulator
MDTAPAFESRYLRCQVCGYGYYEDNFPVGGCPECKSDFVIEEDAPDAQ